MSHRPTIPVLRQADALVIEGTLAGCVFAHALARRGGRTVLTSSACSLPRELVVCRRPWVSEPQLRRLPPPFEAAFRASIGHSLPAGGHLLNLSRLAIHVEDLLLDAGVQLFYAMAPCGAITGHNGEPGAVTFGGKFGLNAIVADRIVDATPTALVAALSGVCVEPRHPTAGTIDVAISAKMNVPDAPAEEIAPSVQRFASERQAVPTAWPAAAEIHVPRVPELIDGRIRLHGPYADMGLRLAVSPSDPLRYARLCNASRRVLLELGTKLNEQRRAAGTPSLLIHRFPGALLTEPLTRATGGLPDHLAICGPAADVADAEAAAWADPFQGAVRAAAMAEGLDHRTPNTECRSSPTGSIRLCSPIHMDRSTSGVHMAFSDAPPLHATDDALPLAETRLPVLADADVLVAGGGTSGVPAALAAARAGANTVLVEQQDDVGGTHTVGGVGNYWYGRETPFHVEYNKACEALARHSGTGMELAMRRLLLEAGVTLLSGCTIAGVELDGTRVAGVVVATDQGPGLVRGKVTLDATGDADLAAWAGAPCAYGNGRDAWTYWGSFANFNEVRRTASRQYESSIEIRDPHDVARTIVTSRRRQGMWRRFAHEMPQHYLAPRESRRLRGDVVVTYRGILAGQTFEDLVTVCESNFDIKGIASSDLIRSGVIWSWNTHRNYAAAIPYRALLPKGVEDLLVVGKAYSASHDALALARMQRDMGCMGASGGIAAARAAQTGIPLRALDVAELQRAWVAAGTLFPADLRRWAKPCARYDAADAERDAAALLRSGSRAAETLARLARSTASIRPLRRAFDAATSRPLKVKMARVLCLLGDATTVPFLLNRIALQIADRLPGPHRRTLSVPPEHGWAGDPVYSLHAIGLTRRAAHAAPLLARIAEMIPDDAGVFASKQESPFEYVRVICTVAERHPGAAMLPALERLLEKRCLHGLDVRFDADPRLTVDSVLERRAYLELCLGRALARCGDPRGGAILRRYRDDVRGCLARTAADALREMKMTSTAT